MSQNSVSHLVLVMGLSGAGKSSALKYLEDIGFHWTDNLPLSLIPTYIEHFNSKNKQDDRSSWFASEHGEKKPTIVRVAIGVHWRDHGSLAKFQDSYQNLSAMVDNMELLFMEASLETLISRYRETRRRHPLVKNSTVQETISLEMQYFEPIRAMADLVIETSRTTVPQLKDRLEQLFQEDNYGRPDYKRANGSVLTIFLRSFGFKFGVNTDADMVLDGRFLPNPYYNPDLRHLNGCDPAIISFLKKDGEALEFLDQLQSLFDYLLPHYQKEKKRYFTIDIGCTGGRHRSVFLVEQLTKRLRHQGFRVLMRHRDLDRETTRLEIE